MAPAVLDAQTYQRWLREPRILLREIRGSRLRPRRYVSASRFYVFYSLHTSLGMGDGEGGGVGLWLAPLDLGPTVWVRGRFVFSILVFGFQF
jgi:hypothetical protein